MVICPIALAVHCTGCPIFKICPVKTIIGDYKGEEVDKTCSTKKPSENNIKKSGDSHDDCCHK